jgi:cytoskeletal protein CcmA (bactofilin family)
MGYLEVRFKPAVFFNSPIENLVVRELVTGNVNAKTVTVAPGGTIHGNITAQSVVSEGKIRGEIDANSVNLQIGSDTISEITSTKLNIDDQAEFSGTCHIKPISSIQFRGLELIWRRQANLN